MPLGVDRLCIGDYAEFYPGFMGFTLSISIYVISPLANSSLEPLTRY